MPLKILQGALPLDPTNFLKKVRQKLLIVTARSQIKIFEHSEPKKFFVHFFSKKWAGFLRAVALKSGGSGRNSPTRQDF